MSKSAKLFGGFFWSTSLNVINGLYGFISIPILLNYFGQQNFALIGIAISINVYLKLMDLGLAAGNVKFFSTYIINNEKKNLLTLFQSSLAFYGAIGIFNFLILAILSFYSDKLFQISTDQISILNILLIILGTSAFANWVFSVFDHFLRANELIGWYQRVQIIPKVFQFVYLFLTIHYKLDLVSFFLGFISLQFITIPIIISKVKTIEPSISFLPVYNKELYKDVLPYCLSIFSFSIFQFSAVYLRPLILSLRSDLYAVTDFRIIEGYANLILIFSSSFVSIFLPLASKSNAINDKSSKNIIIYTGTKFISTFISFVIFFFVINSSDLLELYVGRKYLYLSPLLNIWVLSLLASHNSAISSLVLSSNRLKPIVYISALSTTISLAFSWFAAPTYGLSGVLCGYLIYVLIQTCFYYFYYYPSVLKIDSKKLFYLSFLKPTSILLFNAIITYCLLYSWTFSPVTNIAFKFFIFSTFFILSSTFIFNNDEKTYLKNLASNIFNVINHLFGIKINFFAK